MTRPSQAVVRGARALGSAAEARTLLAHVLAIEPGRLPLVDDVPDAALVAFDALAARRLAGEPLQHLTGRAYFRTIEVEVGPGVFVPRPETESLVGWALERLRELGSARATVVELCAGSGAISLALATELPGPDYRAVERSDRAWPYLARNLEATSVVAVHADMTDALHELDGAVDLVIANPPYVPDSARAILPADVLHDPVEALFGGPDGLDAVAVVARAAARLLRPGGWACCEHDDSQGGSAPAVFRSAGFADVRDHEDLGDRPRFVTARAPRGDLAG